MVVLPIPSTPIPCACGCGRLFTPKKRWRSPSGYTQFLLGHSKNKRPPLAERFWAKVQKTDGCWTWTAMVNHDGYGQIRDGGMSRKMIGAHRVSWKLHFGPIPEGLLVCHHCDNPPCIRPDHLFLGTKTDNLVDMMIKGRGTFLYGEQQCQAKLTDDSVREMRRIYATGTQSMAKLAKVYGVSKTAARFAIRGIEWAHVDGATIAAQALHEEEKS